MPLTPPATNTGSFLPPSPTGGLPSDQAAGTPTPLGTFSSTAYGPPWEGIQGTGVTANGTDLRPARKIYGVAVDPKVIPLGTYLHIWPNPFDWEGTFLAFDTGGAIKGKRIDFYDWRGRSAQNKWGRKNVNVHKATSPGAKLGRPGTGGGLLPSIPNPLNAVDDAATAIKDFVHFILSPKSMGDALAKIFAWFLRLILKALWQYVIAPLFHWHQRAAIHYYEDTVLDKGTDNAKSVLDQPGVKAFVTFSFWATGYAILWARVGNGETSLRPGAAHRSPLGQLLRGVGNTRARRNLVKPQDVQAKTPQKPEPQQSSTVIDKVRSLAVTRPRTVRVSGQANEGTPDE